MSIPRLVEREPGWGRIPSMIQRDQPLFWLSIALLAVGGTFLQALVGRAMVVDPGPAGLMIVGWSLYALPFVTAIVVLDLHEPEPPAMLSAAFAWGALVAVPIAYVANTSLRSIMYKRLDDDLVRSWSAASSGPWTEEILKALGLVVIVALARRQVTTVLDGIVYGAFIGLGFQVAENVALTASSLQGLYASSGGETVIHYLAWRGLGLGLWSHAVYTAIVGAGVAFAVNRTGRRWVGFLAVAGCLVTAGTLHFLWNAPWWQPVPGHPGLAAGIYVAKGLPALVLVTVLVAASRSREVGWFADALVDQPGVTEAEVTALRTWHGRRRARTSARATGGRRARLAVKALQSAQVRLAVAVALGGDPADVDAATRRFADLRHDLDEALKGGGGSRFSRRARGEND